MAWTVPMTWTNGLLVTNTHLNTHVRDNLDYLKNPPTATVATTTARTTTSTSFVTVDGTYFKHSLTTAGGDVLVGFQGVVTSSTNATVSFTVEVDGVKVSGSSTHGIWKGVNVGTGGAGVTLSWLATGLSPGVHTFELFWKTSTGTLTLEPNTNQFWAREIS